MLITQKSWVEWAAGLLVIVCTVLQLVQIDSMVNLQSKYFDTLQVLYPRASDNHHVVVVDIDEKSLSEIGQWPWDRVTMSHLIDNLKSYQVPLVGFDILFSEYDRTSPNLIAKQLQDRYPALANDLEKIPTNESILAKSMMSMPTVTAQSSSHFPNQYPTPPSSIKAIIGEKPNQLLYYFPHLLSNVPEIDAAAKGIGFISLIPEHDGIIRRIVLVNYINDNFYPALSAEMIRVAFQGNSFVVKSNTQGIKSLIMQTPRGKAQIPTDNLGRVWVHYSRPDHTNTKNSIYISASDIINKTVKPELLKGKISIIGTSAIGLKDIRQTPNSVHLPGVEVHVNILENLINSLVYQKPLIHRPQILHLVEPIITLVFSLIILVFSQRKSVISQISLITILSGILLGYSQYAFVYQHILFDPTISIINITLIFSWITLAHYIYEEIEKKRIHDAFNQYLSPAMVKDLSSSKDKLKLGGEEKRMSIMLCDIKNFTGISEKTKSNPEELTTMINKILTPLTDIILSHNGTIDKYIGDCIMAFWNAPIDVEQHEQKAAQAAYDMQKAMPSINQSIKDTLETYGLSEIGIRVGINSGTCIVGNIGSNQRFDYSVLGDTVNLAARLESLGKTYQVDLLVSEYTYKLVDKDSLIELDRVCVKGKNEPVSIYTHVNDPSDSDRAIHQEFMTAYRSNQWEKALNIIQQASKIFNGEISGYYGYMEKRIQSFQSNPPDENWQGVFHLQNK